MCGRYVIQANKQLLQKRYQLREKPEIEPHYNIPPGTPVLAIRQATDGAFASLLHWGLIPRWANDPSIGSKLSNARAETLEEKPAFCDAYRKRRCIIPASGFYEWKRRGNNRQPYFFEPTKEPLFSFAGLWEAWKAHGSDRVIESCTVITTAANATMAPIHHRMPVVLDKPSETLWLSEDSPMNAINGLLAPLPPEAIRCHPVSDRVNRTANDDPSLLEAVDAPPLPEQMDLF